MKKARGAMTKNTRTNNTTSDYLNNLAKKIQEHD